MSEEIIDTVQEGSSTPKPPKPKPPVPPAPPASTPDAAQTPIIPKEAPVTVQAAPAKSPLAAAMLSLMPFGLGHLYLGQYARAVAFFAGFWIPILMLGLPLLGVFIYFLAVFDAYRQAQLINLAAESGVEHPAGAFQGGLAAGVFLVVLGGVLILKNWFDMYWIREFFQDWWPALLVFAGIYFIWGAIRENRQDESVYDLEE